MFFKAELVAGRKSHGFICVKVHVFCHRTVLPDTHRPGNKCNVILSSS